MSDPKKYSVIHSTTRLGQELRLDAEEIQQEEHAHTAAIQTMTRADILATVHELRVHQIELEMQNEELRQMQNELQSVREHYVDLYNFVPVGYCSFSKAGLILQANLTAANLLGVPRQDLVQQSFFHFINIEDRDIFYRFNKQLTEIGKSHKCELRMMKKDGTQFWASLVAMTAQGLNGVSEIRIVIIDISERRKIQEELLVKNVDLKNAKQSLEESNAILIKSTEQLSAFIQHAPMSIAMFDLNMNYLATNDGWIKDYGRGKQSIIGLNHYELHPNLPAEWKRFHQLSLGGATFKNQEDKWVQPDGSCLWLRWTLQPWLDEHGAIGGIIIYAEDITLRKAQESRLFQSEQRLYGLFNSAIDAIITVDEESHIVMYNPAAATMFGVSITEAIGASLDIFIPAHFCPAKRSIGDLEAVVGKRSNGEEFPIEATISYIEIQGKKLYTVIIRDRTQNKKVEAELQLYQEQLRGLIAHQQHIKEDERIRIAREIHDELGSVLTGIKANLSVAMHEDETAGITPNRRVSEACTLLDSAVNTVRKVITELRPSVLDQLGVWAALEWYAEQIEARSGLRCMVDISEKVQKIDVDTERSTALFRMLQESLTNVTRHANASRVEIRVTVIGDSIKMEIEDDGRGIDSMLPEQKSWGIAGMVERVRFFGGSIRITDTTHGTLVSLQLPLEKNV